MLCPMSSSSDVTSRIEPAPHDSTATAPRPGLVRLANGVQLSYAEQGPPSETALLLLHGLSDTWRSFEPLLACLPPSLRVVAVTLRGHGQSEHPAAGYGLGHFSDDVGQVLDALKLTGAVLAGHSLGAGVALRFALDHGARALGIALLGTFARYRHNAAVTELASAVGQLVDPVDSAFLRDFQLATLARPIAPERLEQAVAESRAVPARVWKAIVDALLSAESDLDLRDVQVPTLLLWGGRDAFVPRADQQRLLRDIRGARLVEYPDAGHAFHWEDPRPTANELSAFAEACRVGERARS